MLDTPKVIHVLEFISDDSPVNVIIDNKSIKKEDLTYEQEKLYVSKIHHTPQAIVIDTSEYSW